MHIMICRLGILNTYAYAVHLYMFVHVFCPLYNFIKFAILSWMKHKILANAIIGRCVVLFLYHYNNAKLHFVSVIGFAKITLYRHLLVLCMMTVNKCKFIQILHVLCSNPLTTEGRANDRKNTVCLIIFNIVLYQNIEFSSCAVCEIN